MPDGLKIVKTGLHGKPLSAACLLAQMQALLRAVMGLRPALSLVYHEVDKHHSSSNSSYYSPDYSIAAAAAAVVKEFVILRMCSRFGGKLLGNGVGGVLQ